MKTILKVTLGILLAAVVIIVGLSLLITSGADEVKKEGEKYSMTTKEFKSVPNDITLKELKAKYGQPDPDQTQTSETAGQKTTYVYYNVSGGKFLDTYQFAFTNGKLDAKSRY